MHTLIESLTENLRMLLSKPLAAADGSAMVCP